MVIWWNINNKVAAADSVKIHIRKYHINIIQNVLYLPGLVGGSLKGHSTAWYAHVNNIQNGVSITSPFWITLVIRKWMSSTTYRALEEKKYYAMFTIIIIHPEFCLKLQFTKWKTTRRVFLMHKYSKKLDILFWFGKIFISLWWVRLTIVEFVVVPDKHTIIDVYINCEVVKTCWALNNFIYIKLYYRKKNLRTREG